MYYCKKCGAVVAGKYCSCCGTRATNSLEDYLRAERAVRKEIISELMKRGYDNTIRCHVFTLTANFAYNAAYEVLYEEIDLTEPFFEQYREAAYKALEHLPAVARSYFDTIMQNIPALKEVKQYMRCSCGRIPVRDLQSRR